MWHQMLLFKEKMKCMNLQSYGEQNYILSKLQAYSLK